MCSLTHLAYRCEVTARRWAFDNRYAVALVDHGYWIDCSVTPNVSWSNQMGSPAGVGGVDYRHFPSDAYFVDLTDISRKGTSKLLELPMTVVPHYQLLTRNANPCLSVSTLLARMKHQCRPRNVWLRPRRGNVNDLLAVLEWAHSLNRPYVEFMLHSSELMPGGSPTFPHQADIEQLYTNLECLFAAATQCFRGKTLTEYYKDWHAPNSEQSLV